jgi:hypothetical protein
MPRRVVRRAHSASVGWLADGGRYFLCFFAVCLGRSRVGLGLFMFTLLVMMCRLHVVMGRHVVVSGCLKMMLDCFGLCIGNHWMRPSLPVPRRP